jgi:hypothetical protein
MYVLLPPIRKDVGLLPLPCMRSLRPASQSIRRDQTRSNACRGVTCARPRRMSWSDRSRDVLQDAPTATPSAPTESSSATSLVLATAVDTPHGHAEPATRRFTGRPSTPTAPPSTGQRPSESPTSPRSPRVAGRQLCVMAKRAAVCSDSTPCQLRVTSFASKSRLVDRHPLYVPARAAPHVRASHYGLRLAHDSKE